VLEKLNINEQVSIDETAKLVYDKIKTINHDLNRKIIELRNQQIHQRIKQKADMKITKFTAFKNAIFEKKDMFQNQNMLKI
jgi:sensor domain CHASE-containing protein